MKNNISKKEIETFYSVAKEKFLSIILDAIFKEEIKPNDNIIVISFNRRLDIFNSDKNAINGWDFDRTLRQYILGTSKKWGNIPNFILSQTLRYYYTEKINNPNFEFNTQINDEDIFVPVIPNQIIVNEFGNFIEMSKIFPNDRSFINKLRSEIKTKFPNYDIKFINVIGNGSNIKVNGHILHLNNDFLKIKLVNNENNENNNNNPNNPNNYYNLNNYNNCD